MMFLAILMISTMVSPAFAARTSIWYDSGRQITIYYQGEFNQTFAYFSTNGVSWTAKPGIIMQNLGDEAGTQRLTVRIGQSKGLYIAFTDGAGNWDFDSDTKGKSRYYYVPASFNVVTIANGTVTKGKLFDVIAKNPNLPKVNSTKPYVPFNPKPNIQPSTPVPTAVPVKTDEPTVVQTNVPVITKAPTAAPTATPKAQVATNSKFTWDNASVYFVLTDRFVNGDTSNDNSYGREIGTDGKPISGFNQRIGTFHGGDLKGLTKKLNDGYFTDLGVNAIWVTSPVEQTHGWVTSDHFRSYAYHGYWAMDFSEIDKNMGTKAEFQEFVDTAHKKGIRVVLDVVMNHAGYNTIQDMTDYEFGEVIGDWKSYYYDCAPEQAIYDNISKYYAYNDANKWGKWWGADWVRAGLPGYEQGGSNDITMNLAYLPDFKTESRKEVGLPPFLLKKWGSQKDAKLAELDAYFKSTGKPRTVRNYLIKWLTDYVRDYGVDGFRVDTAKHVELDAWKDLKTEASKALKEWKSKNPTKKLDDLDFWMTGEVFDHGVGRDAYFDNGYDSLINFQFQSIPDRLNSIESVYANYASQINGSHNFNALSYVSSHDKGLYNRNNLLNAGTALLLAPGGIQIYYGDESGRPQVNAPSDEKARGDMNWSSMDKDLLAHWQKIGQFRNRHVSVGGGSHKQIESSPYTFSRSYDRNGMNDQVVVAIGAGTNSSISVGGVFADGTKVHEAYSDQTVEISSGHASLNGIKNGIVLLELAQ